MSNINIHIYQSDITKESRMFKISKTLEEITSFEQIILAGIQSNNLPLTEKRSQRIFIRRAPVYNIKSRLAHYLIYYFWLCYLIIKIRPKVLNIHSLELLPYAFLAKIFLRSMVIYDTHELETEKIGMTPFRKKISLMIEKFFIHYCDKVIVVGEAIASHYKKLYPKKDTPDIILNVPRLINVRKNNKFRQLFGIDKNTIIYLYQGVLNQGRGIDIILKSFEKVKRADIAVVFLGYGPYKELIKERTRKQHNIFFHEAVSPEELLEFTSSADVGLCLIENKCLSYYYSLPNKMFEYTMAGLPVITSKGYEMSKLVYNYGIGYSLDESNFTDILENISWDSVSSMKGNLDKFKNKYNWENQEVILKNIYANL